MQQVIAKILERYEDEEVKDLNHLKKILEGEITLEKVCKSLEKSNER